MAYFYGHVCLRFWYLDVDVFLNTGQVSCCNFAEEIFYAPNLL